MSAEDLTRAERRDVAVFAIGVGVIVSTVVVFAVAHSTWKSRHWSAGVAAAATTVQAAAVIGALFYASRQVRVSRELAKERRVTDLLDQLTPLVYEDFQAAVIKVTSAARALSSDVEHSAPEAYMVEFNATRADCEALISKWYDEDRERAVTADAALTTIAGRVVRLLTQLGFARNITVMGLRIATLGINGVLLPKLPGEVTDQVTKFAEAAKSLERTRSDVVKLVDALTERYAPLDSATRDQIQDGLRR